MKNSGKLVSFLVPIISILLAFVIGCIIMAVLGGPFFLVLLLRQRGGHRDA